jgi:thiol:disulfide interchange protein DsbD
LATVVWLVWVLGQQSGIDGAATLLALLLLLTLVVWTLTLPGRGRAILAPLSIALGAWLAWAWGPKIWELPAPPAWSAASAQADAAPGQWQPWQADLPARLLAQGRPVFIDYTAAWCVTCQYNKQTTLADAAVLQDFAAKGVTLLRADWTRRDPAITAALTALGRSGVPVYVLHAPGRAPVVFSEILGRSELRAALADL